jgi:ribosomal protein uS17
MAENEQNEEQIEETPAAPESLEETPAEAETPVEEPEAVADEAAAEEPAADEPAAETEEAVEGEENGGEVSDESGRAPSASPTELAAKKKRRRLPRRLRPQKTRARRAPSGERKPIVREPKPEHDRGRRQERRGVVVSSAMDKTIVVKVDVITSHQRYKKVIRRSVKFHAHDEQNTAKVGDIVRIVETRPLSKTKRWRLAEVVEAAK